MRFRVQNIRNGYCEIWANERDGQRYQKRLMTFEEEQS